jgi:hypothetical protein
MEESFQKALQDKVNCNKLLEEKTNPRKIYKRLDSTKHHRIKVGGRPIMMSQDFTSCRLITPYGKELVH